MKALIFVLLLCLGFVCCCLTGQAIARVGPIPETTGTTHPEDITWGGGDYSTERAADRCEKIL